VVAIACFALVIGALIGVAVGAAIGRSDDETAASEDLADRDDQAAADIARFTAEIEADPESVDAHVGRAEAYVAQWDLDKAIDDYDRAIALDPGNAELLAGRGGTHATNGDRQAAIADYTAAIEIDPDNASLYLERGSARAWDGQPEAAIEDFSASIDRYRLSPDAFRQRAWAYESIGDYDAAIDDWSSLIRLEDYWSHYQNRSRARLANGDIDGAIDDLSAAMEIPDAPVAYLLAERGDLYVETGRTDQARSDYDAAIGLDPDYGPYARRGRLLFQAGDVDGALADYDRGAEYGDVQATYLRALLLIDEGRWVEADHDLTDVLAQFDEGYLYEYGYGLLEPPAISARTVLYHRARARAGAGDLVAAAADLDRYRLEMQALDEPTGGMAEVDAWIAELDSGTNPFEG
jgi:tetratricopeptide (TPR) repeat protein